MNEITVHALLEHQEPIARSDARFKVLRAGRRWGKDALAENVSLLGHGPSPDGGPLFKGLIHGFDIVWLAPSIPQASAMWKNDVEPRFRGRDRVEVNKVEKTVTFVNPDGSAYSTLWVRSAEAIHSIRGIGRRLAGIVINEAAWMDLEMAWRDVLRPTLMDCGGWALIMSTTNGGPDGYEDEAGKRSPSFFNLLCEQIQKGERGPEWVEFYGTARENPKIVDSEFDALVEEYPTDSVTLAQEVFAKLVVGGAGLAFPEWAEDAHIARYNPETDDRFRWSGGGDWGYERRGCLYLIASGPERALVRHEFSFRRLTPYDAAFQFGQQIKRFPRPEWLSIDTPAVSDGGPTILEQLQRGLNDACGKGSPPFVNPPKGSGSRATKKTLLHDALKYTRTDDGTIPPWGMPRLQFHPDCRYILSTLPKLPRDPKKPDDVDTNADDHGYDGITSWLMARTPFVVREVTTRHDPDVHPGWTDDGARRQTGSPDPFAEVDGPRWSRHAGVG